MQDNAREQLAQIQGPALKAQLVQEMEKYVTVEVNDRDYRNVYTPCLPLDGAIEHWK